MENAGYTEQAIDMAKKAAVDQYTGPELEEVINESLQLVKNSGVALIGSIGDGGFPNIKAMLNLDSEGLKTMWFSTNTSSKRVGQYKRDPRACVYFLDQQNFKGVMLIGEMEVLNDPESRRRLWKDGCEVYYPLGVDDPDYSVLRFTAKKGNYYHGLKNLTFEV